MMTTVTGIPLRNKDRLGSQRNSSGWADSTFGGKRFNFCLMKAFLKFSMVTLLVFGMGGCASTPDRRIAAEAELFQTFPEAVQQQVREGTVALGFTEDMVRLALGEPHRRISRETAEGRSVYWIYLGSYLVSDSYLVRDFGRFSRDRYGHTVVDRTRQEFYEKMRLEFRDGEVVAAEQLERR